MFHTIQSGPPLNFAMGTDVALNGTGQQTQHAQLVPGATYADIPLDHPDRNAFVNSFSTRLRLCRWRSAPRHLWQRRPEHHQRSGYSNRRISR